MSVAVFGMRVIPNSATDVHQIIHAHIFYWIILITVTLASSNNTLPDDGD
jgi:hypothetical protein